MGILLSFKKYRCRDSVNGLGKGIEQLDTALSEINRLRCYVQGFDAFDGKMETIRLLGDIKLLIEDAIRRMVKSRILYEEGEPYVASRLLKPVPKILGSVGRKCTELDRVALDLRLCSWLYRE